MKRIVIQSNSIAACFLLSGFLAFVLSGCSSKILLTPAHKPNRVVLSNFHVVLKHFNTDQFNTGDYSSLLVALSEPAFPSADLIQVHRSFNSKQNNHIKQQLDSVYIVVQRDFKSMGIDLLPSGYLASKRDIPVGPYGFPHSSDTKTNAQVADAALNITIQLQSQGIDVSRTTPYTRSVRYRPRLVFEMTMMSGNGTVIWKDQEISISNQLVHIEENTSGVKTLEVQAEPALSNMVDAALQKMIHRLPSSVLRTP